MKTGRDMQRQEEAEREEEERRRKEAETLPDDAIGSTGSSWG